MDRLREKVKQILAVHTLFNVKPEDLSHEKKEKIITQLEQESLKCNLIDLKINRNIIKDCDVIGFDIDHTLGIYNLTSLGELLYTSFVKFLIFQRNYPKNLDVFNLETESENVKSEVFKFLTKSNFYKYAGTEVLFDVKRGIAIKFSQNLKIFKAFFGLKELTEEEIKYIYGEEMKIPAEYNFDFENPRNWLYHYYTGYLENQIVAVYLFCIELYKRRIIVPDNKNIPKYDPLTDKFHVICDEYNDFQIIMNDIIDATTYTFKIQENKKLNESGYFYPEISRNPDKYICGNSARDALFLLRNIGKKIFIATNSTLEFAQLILGVTLGEDFLDLVDLFITNSSKPSFFRVLNNESEINEVNFSFFDCNNQKYMANNQQKIITLKALQDDPELFEELKTKKSIEGKSFEIPKLFFEKLLNKKDLNFIFVGDSTLNDCMAPSKHRKISSIVIIENIKAYYHGVRPDDLGEFWELEEAEEREEYYVSVARDYAEFAISNVQTLRLLC